MCPGLLSKPQGKNVYMDSAVCVQHLPALARDKGTLRLVMDMSTEAAFFRDSQAMPGNLNFFFISQPPLGFQWCLESWTRIGH